MGHWVEALVVSLEVALVDSLCLHEHGVALFRVVETETVGFAFVGSAGRTTVGFEAMRAVKGALASFAHEGSEVRAHLGGRRAFFRRVATGAVLAADIVAVVVDCAVVERAAGMDVVGAGAVQTIVLHVSVASEMGVNVGLAHAHTGRW